MQYSIRGLRQLSGNRDGGGKIASHTFYTGTAISCNDDKTASGKQHLTGQTSKCLHGIEVCT